MFNEWLDKNAFTVKKVTLSGTNKPVLAIILPHYQGGMSPTDIKIAQGVVRLVNLDGRVALVSIANITNIQVTRIMDKSLRAVIDDVIKIAKEWNKCNINLLKGVRGYTYERLNNTEMALKTSISYLPNAYAKAYKSDKDKKVVSTDAKVQELKESLIDLSYAFHTVSYLFEVVELRNGDDINNYIVDKYPFNNSFDEVSYDVAEWVEATISRLGSNVVEFKKGKTVNHSQKNVVALKGSLQKLSKTFCKVSNLIEIIELPNGRDMGDFIAYKYPFKESFGDINDEVMEWVEDIIEKL